MKTKMVLVRMPVGLHKVLKHTAFDKGTSLAGLVAQLCAKGVGFKLEPAKKKVAEA